MGLGTDLVCINITVPCTREEAFWSPFSGQADFASQGAPRTPLHTLVCPSLDSFYSHCCWNWFSDHLVQLYSTQPGVCPCSPGMVLDTLGSGWCPSHGGEMNHTMLANLWVLDSISCFSLELITPSHGESQRAVTKVLSSGLRLCYWLTGLPCCSTLSFLLPCVTLHRNKQALKTWFHCQICFGENLSKDENL